MERGDSDAIIDPFAGGFTKIVMPELDDRRTLYTEAFTTRSFQTRGEPIYTLDEPLTCAPIPDLKFDQGANVSLNGVAPRAQLDLGPSLWV